MPKLKPLKPRPVHYHCPRCGTKIVHAAGAREGELNCGECLVKRIQIVALVRTAPKYLTAPDRSR
jgi:DNA-directed RNA polymerase subunit RPC12/RpoP